MPAKIPFSVNDMITSEKARQIAVEVQNVRSDARRARVLSFLAEADERIREAAANGKNTAAWIVGTNEFERDILLELRGRGFKATFKSNQFVVDW